jgi:hypothetical protein
MNLRLFEIADSELLKVKSKRCLKSLATKRKNAGSGKPSGMFLPCPPKPAENDFDKSILRHPPGGGLTSEPCERSLISPKRTPVTLD